ncbi:dienelactone hydrolase [Marinomonas piezotolerans]|uniref:Dienelactone hydrolase n=1 Tax=Marinomonas piezotolerans TaxID=2213058 RepID=A0A370U9U4_9GAMM|nr:dienelactone hydrolase family protein [Marinomonas piezotolerans]RDL44556.1 dienelactone hydrolase [Marinomonas piezotolerans]
MSSEFEKQFIDGVTRSHSHVAWDGETTSDVHVIVWPTWGGLSDFEKRFASDVASWGHSTTAVDLYGVGNNPTKPEDKANTLKTLVANQAPLTALLSDITKEIESSYPSKKIVHVGFCLGGRLAIEAGLHIPSSAGAVSYHGLMNFYRVEPECDANQSAKFLVCNGYQDPMVDEDSAESARAYFDELGVDWQFIDFGNAKHSFMLPQANAPQEGHEFSPEASARGRTYLRGFLEEINSQK